MAPSAPAKKPPIHRLIDALQNAAPESPLNDLVREIIQGVVDKHSVANRYNVLILHDDTSIVRADADRIYRAIAKFTEQKPILLVLCSNGGEIGSGYLISKLCREHATGEFVVAVPREAKSAATLICCGADKIHMGSLSELGPIDPQIKGRPALALKQSVEHLAELTKTYPSAAEMFAAYLNKSLGIEQLGYYERIAESAVQYAERLLLKRREPPTFKAATALANTLVYSYKDHGFVIDVAEATSIFGVEIVVRDTGEYRFADAMYGTLNHVQMLFELIAKKHFYFVGSMASDCNTFSIKDRD